MRSCAYCLEALNGCINSENQVTQLHIWLYILFFRPEKIKVIINFTIKDLQMT